MAYLSAFLLSMMVPERAAALQARATEYAHNRVVCGDHYSSDVPANKEAAPLIMGNILGSVKFQEEFAGAKVKVRKALGL